MLWLILFILNAIAIRCAPSAGEMSNTDELQTFPEQTYLVQIPLGSSADYEQNRQGLFDTEAANTFPVRVGSESTAARRAIFDSPSASDAQSLLQDCEAINQTTSHKQRYHVIPHRRESSPAASNPM